MPGHVRQYLHAKVVSAAETQDLSEQDCSHFLRRFPLQTRDDVGIQVQGHGNRRMAHCLLNDLRVDASSERDGGIGMPKVMLAKKYDWVINNLTSLNPDRHFVVLVSYEDRIGDATMPAPRVWVLPFPDVEPFRRTYKGNMKTLSRAQMLKDGKQYENAWNLIE